MTNATRPRLRIASLLASATEMVCGVGLIDSLVAISHECDWPIAALDRPRVTRTTIDANASSAAIDAQVRELSSAGLPLYEIDRAKLTSLVPDLIVTQAQCDVCAIRYDDVVRIVREEPALKQTQVLSLSPTSMNDVLEDIRRIGVATGAQAKANSFVRLLAERLDRVASAVAPAIRDLARPRVAIVEWIEPLMLAANWSPDLVQRAGGDHRLTVDGGHSVYADWQSVAKFDPETLIIAPCGFSLGRTMDEWKSAPRPEGYSTWSAVRSGNVFAVDGNALLHRAGPRLVDSVELLAGLIHPNVNGLRTRLQSDHLVPYWRRVD